MKRVLTSTLGALIVVLPSLAAAQETRTVTGTITAIGPSSITIKAADKEMKFNVDGETDIIAQGAGTATRAARAAGKPGVAIGALLKVGQHVEVRYHEQGMHAAHIRVVPTAGAGGGRSTTAKGVVSAVSGTSLTVKGTEGDSTFAIDEKTEVIGTGIGTRSRELKEAGKKPAITDFVAKGDSVEVTYHESSGKKLASTVRVTAKGGK